MASSRITLRHLRVLAAASAAVALTLVPGFVSASPSSTQTPAQQVAALNAQLDKAVEVYDQARLTVSKSQATQRKLAGQITAQRAQVAGYQKQVAGFAADAYKTGGLTPMASLLDSGSPQNFLDQMATLNHLSAEQHKQLTDLIAAQRKLAGQEKQVTAALKTQQDAEKKAAGTKAQLASDLAKAQALVAAQQRAAAPAGTSASSAGTRASRGSARSAPPSYTGPATGSAAAALRFAYAQLGKPYVWGADGPGSYDCSGLTMASWHAGGVSLPHSSAAQYNSAPHVSLSALRPGDLIFYGSPIHHVAIYIGGGQIIHAPVPGETVRIASMDMESPVGAVRP